MGPRRELLLRGVDVIVDFGFWARAERDDFRARAAVLGADCLIHYADVPIDVLLARLSARNASPPPGAFTIPESALRAWAERFEPPATDEQPVTMP